MIMLLKLNRS